VSVTLQDVSQTAEEPEVPKCGTNAGCARHGGTAEKLNGDPSEVCPDYGLSVR